MERFAAMTDVEAAHLAPDATGVEATSTAVATTAGDLPQQRVAPSLQTLTGNSPGLRQLALDHAHCVGEARPVKDRAVECLCHTPPCLHGVIPRQLHRSLASQRPLRRPDPAGFTRSHAPELLWRFGHAPTSTPGLQRHSHLGLVAEPRSARATAADLPCGGPVERHPCARLARPRGRAASRCRCASRRRTRDPRKSHLRRHELRRKPREPGCPLASTRRY